MIRTDTVISPYIFIFPLLSYPRIVIGYPCIFFGFPLTFSGNDSGEIKTNGKTKGVFKYKIFGKRGGALYPFSVTYLL